MKDIQELFLFNSNCMRDTCLKEKGAVDRKENVGDIMGKAQQYKGEGAEEQSILNNQPQIHIEHSLIISIFRSTLMNIFLTSNSSFLYYPQKFIPYFLSISLFCIFPCNFHSLVIIYIGDSSL